MMSNTIVHNSKTKANDKFRLFQMIQIKIFLNHFKRRGTNKMCKFKIKQLKIKVNGKDRSFNRLINNVVNKLRNIINKMKINYLI
jgi:ribosome-associated translation inhibitor RaiA